MADDTHDPQRMGRPPTGGPRRNVTMQLPIDELAQVDAAAATAQLSRTEFIRRAYLEAIRRLYEAEVSTR